MPHIDSILYNGNGGPRLATEWRCATNEIAHLAPDNGFNSQFQQAPFGLPGGNTAPFWPIVKRRLTCERLWPMCFGTHNVGP